MSRKVVLGMMLTLLLIGMLILTFNIQPAKSDWTWTETIYIKADGSVYPDTAPISSVDNITYTLTDNIVGDVPEDTAIVVERDNIIVNGAGYTVQDTQASGSKGIYLTWRSNVTIKNVEIKTFHDGIYLYRSLNNTISGNNITNNNVGGIYLDWSSNNTISGNNITNNDYGIRLIRSSNNIIYHNNFVDNSQQVRSEDSTNIWDDGYPSGGNYWSDHNPPDEDFDKIGDVPYVIHEDNADRYPLIYPYGFVPSIDVNEDAEVNMTDVGICCLAYGSYPSHTRWNYITDINIDEKINMKDIGIICLHYGEEVP